MLRSVSLCLFIAAVGGLAGCTSDYSPNTYASSAVQQANKVEPGIVVGFRQVAISANGTVGAVSGGAAGGILGAQVGTGGMNAALGTVGGTAIGGLLGTAMEHIAGDTNGWEYIVRKSNGELLSLTQKEPQPLPIGQKVLVITGSQARIVPDYSTPRRSRTREDRFGEGRTSQNGDGPPGAPEVGHQGGAARPARRAGPRRCPRSGRAVRHRSGAARQRRWTDPPDRPHRQSPRQPHPRRCHCGGTRAGSPRFVLDTGRDQAGRVAPYLSEWTGWRTVR
ncbi:hypothetical protein ACHMW5_11425 [Azospirillum melinis]|uniref:outer membrane lipoprotein n=1 Tax=Azospirillum melinis TaxID=328839 RepID=UPI003756AE49